LSPFSPGGSTPGKPTRRGFDRNGTISDESLKDESLRVRREAEMLAVELPEAKARSAPDGVEYLEHGSDRTSIVIEYPEHGASTCDFYLGGAS
jgi:hypothetical protein